MRSEKEVEIHPVIKKAIKTRPLQLLGWGICIYVAGVLFVNPFLAAYYEISFFDVYNYRTTALLSHSIVSIIVLLTAVGVIGLTVHQYNNIPIINPKPKSKTEPESIVTPIVDDVAAPPLVITNGKSTFLKSGVSGTTITIDNNESTLYNWDDLQLQLKTNPHWLIVGSSGSGKTHSTRNLLKVFNTQLRYPQMIIADAGGVDYEGALARTNDEIRGAIDLIYWVAKGRMCELQADPKTYFPPIIFLLEETEVFLSELALLPKKQSAEFFIRLARLLLTCRKLNINFVFVLQTGAASIIPTNLTNNIANHLYLRMGKRASTYIYKLKLPMNALEPGIAYYPSIEAFVKFKEMPQPPPLNVLSWYDLETMANTAKRKHNLDLEPVEIEQ